MSETDPTSCLTGNICASAAQENPLCGSTYNHLPPLLLAEDLCPQALAGAIKAEQERIRIAENPRPEVAQHFVLGSLLLDLALSPAIRSSSAEAFMDKAFNHLDQSAAIETNAPHRFSSMLLSTHQQAFRNMGRKNIPPSKEAIQDAQANVISALQGPLTDGHFRGRAGMHLLFARHGGLVFPANAREQNALGLIDSDPLSGHALYAVNSKIGVKEPYHLAKSPKSADMSRFIVTRFSELAKSTLDSVRPSTVKDDVRARELVIDWLCEEAGGASLGDKQEQVLSSMYAQIMKKRGHWHGRRVRAERALI